MQTALHLSTKYIITKSKVAEMRALWNRKLQKLEVKKQIVLHLEHSSGGGTERERAYCFGMNWSEQVTAGQTMVHTHECRICVSCPVS